MSHTETDNGVIAYFTQALQSYDNPETRNSYGKFVTSFRKYLAGRDIPFSEITPEMTTDWQQSLIRQGRTRKYLMRLGKHFRTLYHRAVAEGLAPRNDEAFAWVKDVSEPGADLKSAKNRYDALLLLRALHTLSLEDKKPFERARDLFLIATLLGGLTFADLYALRPADYADGRLRVTIDERERRIPVSPLVEALIARNRSDDPAHLLACYQRNLSAADAAAQWYARIVVLLKWVSPKDYPVDEQLPSRLSESAMRDADVSLHAIRASLVHIWPSSTLTALLPKAVAQRHTDAAYLALSNAVSDTTRRWYALRMTEDYPRFEHTLAVLGFTDQVECYYPMETIARQSGRKIEEVKSPVLKRILFIRATDATLLRFAQNIFPHGHLYRSPRGSRRPYAVISQRAMSEFRRLVSHGTDFDEADYAANNNLPPQTLVTLTGDTLTGKDALIIRPVGKKKYLVQILDAQFSMTYEVSKAFIKRK